MKKQLIYKYLPFSTNSLRLLINGELWFGVPKNQNDPFEGEFVTKNYYSLPTGNMIEFYYKYNPDLLNGDSLENKIYRINEDSAVFQNDIYVNLKKRLKEHYGVSCFSYVNNNVLMWSHYTNSHKGFCVIFDKELLNKTIKYPSFMLTGFCDVFYDRKLPVAELIIEREKIGFVSKKKILIQKLRLWKYEKETRLIAFYANPSNERNIGFDKKSVTGIILGERMSIEDKKMIKNIVKNNKDYSQVVFYETFKDFKTLKMKIVKC